MKIYLGILDEDESIVKETKVKLYIESHKQIQELSRVKTFCENRTIDGYCNYSGDECDFII
jgi:hypothetical protein